MFGTAVILAGGKSTRMGFDKQMLMENDRRMMARIVETLKTEFDDVVVVTARPELYGDMDVRLTDDVYRGRGPMAGLHAAMLMARSRYVYLLACDMPMICLALARHMKSRVAQTGAPICAGEADGMPEPFGAFYNIDLLPEITRRLEADTTSLRRFISACDPCLITPGEAAMFEGGREMFTNLNTQSELQAYLGVKIDEDEADFPLVGMRDIVRYIGGKFVPMRDLMVHEKTLRLIVSGEEDRTLYCSPDELEPLVVGYLLAQRRIRRMEDILSLEVDGDAGVARAVVAPPAPYPDFPLDDTRDFDPDILLSNQQRFYDQSTLQKATAGTHCCALCDDSGTYFSCVDISRHNCLDKLAGKALMTGVSLSDKYILTSGRVPMDMIRKVEAIGVPMIVSRSTPTIAAVEVARQRGITLLGFSREHRFNIYSAPHRLRGCGLHIPGE